MATRNAAPSPQLFKGGGVRGSGSPQQCRGGSAYSKSRDQSGKVVNPARSQLNRGNYYIFPCLRSRLRTWSRETGSVVPSRVSLLISILRLKLVLTYGIPPECRGGVYLFILNRHTPSGQSHEFVGSRDSLRRVPRYRASKLLRTR